MTGGSRTEVTRSVNDGRTKRPGRAPATTGRAEPPSAKGNLGALPMTGGGQTALWPEHTTETTGVRGRHPTGLGSTLVGPKNKKPGAAGPVFPLGGVSFRAPRRIGARGD